MKTNALFRECLQNVSAETKAEFELSFAIADRIAELLQEKGMTQKQLAEALGKRESEVSKWLTGRHNFTTNTLVHISMALGEPVITTTTTQKPKPSPHKSTYHLSRRPKRAMA